MSRPFDIPPDPEVYLFCWGQCEAQKASEPDPAGMLRKLAGVNSPRPFEIPVGMRAAAFYVEETPGFEGMRWILEGDFAISVKGVGQLAEHDIRAAFDLWRKSVPQSDHPDVRWFADVLAQRISSHPITAVRYGDWRKAGKLGDIELSSFEGPFTNLETAQFNFLRTFRKSLRRQDIPTARRAWQSYWRIREYLQRRLAGPD